MLCISIPVVDWFDVKDQIDRLETISESLQHTAELLAAILKGKRVATIEAALVKTMEGMNDKSRGDNAHRFGGSKAHIR